MRSLNIKKVIFITICLLTFQIGKSCTKDENVNNRSDYQNPKSWYKSLNESQSSKRADVFYIAPTCIFDWKDSSGQLLHNMDINNERQRAAVNGAVVLAEKLFGDSCNFYAPYYRQITIESWYLYPHTEWQKRFDIAMSDIKSAFDYYIKHINNGRPFILAGHSQGAKAVIELLKSSMNEETYKRLIAAYPIGFSINQTELDQNKYLVPAQDSLDLGVIIAFNSVIDNSGLSPMLKDNKVCINPINWKTDETYADSTKNRGTVFIGPDGSIVSERAGSIAAKINKEHNVLFVEGASADKYYVPQIKLLFPKGSFHVQEFNFYFRNLQKNVIDRMHSWYKKRY